MQTGSTKLLHSFYALANRNFQFLEFHTSTHALKGGPRSKQKYSKARADTQTTRTPARKRLVSTLKPPGNSGSYEVAPRSKSRDKETRLQLAEHEKKKSRQKKHDRDDMVPQVPIHNKKTLPKEFSQHETSPSNESSREIQAGSSSSRDTGFMREGAPHVGRTSWMKPRSPGRFRRESRLDRDNDSTRYGRRSFGFKEDVGSLWRRTNIRSRNFPSEDTRTPDDYYGKQSFNARLPREKGLLQDRHGYDSHSRPERPQPPKLGFPSESDTPPQRLPREKGLLQDRHGYDSHSRPERPQPPKIGSLSEFNTPPQIYPLKALPDHFTSPPLLDGLLQSVHDVLGADAKPSPIQSLSLKHLFFPPSHISSAEKSENSLVSPFTPTWGQYLLASETGSGKSIAYLLPMIQYLKLTENFPAPLPPTVPIPPHRPLPINPRGLILAPTHELSRQLSSFAKSLLHNIRLRVLCASRANNSSSSRGRSSTASQLKRELDDTNFGVTEDSQIYRQSRPVDVLVGTPTKILEMVRGWGWNRAEKIEEQWDDARKERARSWVPGPREAGLTRVDWVVVDEADVLFDADFQESTQMLLRDIALARGYSHPSLSTSNVTSSTPQISPTTPSPPLEYPFHLILTSATIPSSLATYLTSNHPKLTRLASPNLHQLPSTLKTEHHAWTSGNKNSDVERRIRRVWAENVTTSSDARSKILIFCNKSSKVEDLGLYLTEKGIPNVALTSTAQARLHGSNRHLAGFLKTPEKKSSVPLGSAETDTQPTRSTLPSEPNVLITTSLLSRGLDFSPRIGHVFIVDEPRNMIDFLHRAGRTGRAGHKGKVVVFGKEKGRGSGNAKEVKRKIAALAR